MARNRQGRSRRRWDDNVEINVTEIGMQIVKWIHLAQCCEYGDELSVSIKFWQFIDQRLKMESIPWS
jgi:hypothetical protein